MIKTPNYQTIFLIILLITCALLYYLAPICMPFLAGAILAYLSNPLVKKLTKLKIPRLFSVTLVFLLLFVSIAFFFLLFIPLIQLQITTLSEQLPKMMTWLETKILPWITTNLGMENLDINDLKTYIAKNMMRTQEMASWLLHSGKALFHALLNIILIPVVTFYLLRDWEKIIINIRQTLPNRIRPAVVKLTKECDSVLSAFFRGQLLVMFFLAIFYSIALSILGLQLALIIGVIVGITSIVPYLGLIVGLLIASLAALVQFGTLNSVLWVVFIFLIGHSIENFYLTPNLIGDRIGLHPVVVIFAVLAGGALFGFFGVLLALPVAAVILVLLRHMHHRYQGVSV